MDKLKILKTITFGGRVAEEESGDLKRYFVETDEWESVYSNKVDIIYGPKGSGKSAIYSLLEDRRTQLFDKNILYLPAENPRGTTVFKDLELDPPTTEREFEQLWKIYFACLIAATLNEYEVHNSAARKMSKTLQDAGLLVGNESLGEKFRSVTKFVKRFRPKAIEGGIELNSVSGTPSGIKGRLEFDKLPNQNVNDLDADSILGFANDALRGFGWSVWLGVDRLDVAFQEDEELEANALRALFKVYLDVQTHTEIRLMIFIRTDIWDQITSKGFREGSHITRSLTINWSRENLLNLVTRRVMQNRLIVEEFGVNVNEVLGSLPQQDALFYRLFPRKVDLGAKKPDAFDWILTRTCDATNMTAPRELIHYLNEAKQIQIHALNIGNDNLDSENLFSRSALKEALKPVSKVRLEQTIYAEYPNLKEDIQKMEKEKSSQSPLSLSKIWKCGVDEAIAKAEKLATIGFFQKRGPKETPTYWVPFLYRDALDLVQGAAE